MDQPMVDVNASLVDPIGNTRKVVSQHTMRLVKDVALEPSQLSMMTITVTMNQFASSVGWLTTLQNGKSIMLDMVSAMTVKVSGSCAEAIPVAKGMTRSKATRTPRMKGGT